MSKTYTTDVAVRCKAHEAAAEQRAPRHMPLLVRLDGRAFHTYTRGLRRPYDERLSRCMVETTRTLVGGIHAAAGAGTLVKRGRVVEVAPPATLTWQWLIGERK